MVRSNDDSDGQQDVEGWHPNLDTLQFLVSTSAGIDSDEYDSDQP